MQYLGQPKSDVAIAKYAVALMILIRILLYLFRQFRIRIRKNENNRMDPPSAPWIPIVGSLPFMGRYPERVIADWGRNRGYGSVFRVRFGTMNAVVLNDLSSIHEAYVKNGHRMSGRIQTSLIQEMTNGNGLIFLDYGDKWRSMRKFGHSAFKSISANEHLNEIIAEESQMLVAALAKQLNNPESTDEYLCGNYKRAHPPQSLKSRYDLNNNAGEWKLLDPEEFMHKATGNVMCNLLFGRSFRKDEEDYNAVLEETPIQARKSASVFMLVFLVPALRGMPYVKDVIDEALCFRKDTFKMIKEVVDQHISDFTELKPESDFVDCFINEMKNVDREDANENSFFTYDQLLTYVFDIFTAGAETTADTLLWGLLYLSRDLKLQAELRKEIINIGGTNFFPSVNHMSKMHLLKATIQEILRIRPINTFGMPRTATERCTINGYDVPKGSVVLPNVWSVHHDPEVFPEPEVFDVRRHINEFGEFVPSKSVVGFSVGPRQCIGKRIADIDIFFILSSIIRNFEFRLPKVWQNSTKSFVYRELDMKGKNGHVLLAPEYDLEWRRIE
uniref:cytochrome P450 2U1-like n=1 Tax=Styela clava TaxID=7725 RepID=UPI00193ACB11|nr:cytochrome P450 2U1-like [Styela clava]